MPTCRICGATRGECVAPHSTPVHEIDIREGGVVAGELRDVEVEVRPGIVASFQMDARDRARYARPEPDPEPEKPARKARPVAANKAAGTTSTK